MGSWTSKRVRSRRNRGKLHSNVLYFAIEKGGGKRRKLRKKGGTVAENVRYSRFCFNLPHPPPTHTHTLTPHCLRLFVSRCGYPVSFGVKY